MAIKLWWDTNITLTNTSFSCSTWWWDPAMIVSLFTVASAWNYHFEWNFTGNSVMTVALSINGANKEMWIVIWTQNWTYDFTAEVWDVITLEASGSGSGSNLSVVRYADEIKEIYVWEWNLVNDYSAMQWPAPSGFHVPSDNERITLCGILTTTFWLSKNATTMGTYLKMPMAGYRYYWSSNVENAGTYGRYWCYTRYSDVNAYCLYFRSSSLNPQNGYGRANGLTVRCFKDSSTIPTSSWTTLYDWSSVASWAWIFWNSTDGLISVSWDWTTWYTIMDKNLWASTVFNQWDALTDANCGYFYQWGNNYWFPRSWTVTTSSTQVDASYYWPGNYYSSGTFIIWNYDWSSVHNDDLWWWETGVQQKQAWNVTEVYVGTTKVRPLTN